MRRALHIVTLALVAIGLSSCIRARLHDPLSDIFLKTEFVLESGVVLPDGFPVDHPEFAEKITAVKPNTIRICFYDPDSMELIKQEFLPADGGFLDVDPGEYYIVMYAMGTSSSQIYNMDRLNTAFASTNPTGLTLNIFVGETKAVEDYAIFHEPDHLLVCKYEDIVVSIAEEEDVEVIMDIMLFGFSLVTESVESIP